MEPHFRTAMSLFDQFGRQIVDLRVSITDRCNYRCVYCRSADPENYRAHEEILSWGELEATGPNFRQPWNQEDSSNRW